MCNEDEIDLCAGIRDNTLVFIEEVDRGLECNCYCPYCGGRLVAKKGDIKRHHFAHYQVENCGKGLETALHLYAKEVLKTYKKVFLPGQKEPSEIYFIEVERKRFGYIADIGAILKPSDEAIDIEIKVTHGVDQDKELKVINNNADMFEIDLSYLLKSTSISRELITEHVIKNAPRRWINKFNAEIDKTEEDNNMNEKYLVIGFKSVSGYSRKNQASFNFETLHVLVELENRSSQNYQIHSIGGYEQKNIPIKLTPEILNKLEKQTLPTWGELRFETQLLNGTPKALVTDIIF